MIPPPDVESLESEPDGYVALGSGGGWAVGSPGPGSLRVVVRALVGPTLALISETSVCLSVELPGHVTDGQRDIFTAYKRLIKGSYLKEKGIVEELLPSIPTWSLWLLPCDVSKNCKDPCKEQGCDSPQRWRH